MRSIGLDLTDPYARRPRNVDVAVMNVDGRCDFRQLPAPTISTSTSNWLSPICAGPASGDVLVIDGPLALAATGRPMRECERLLGAPGKTPDTLPRPGSKPFAGYIRGSLELAEALAAQGWVPLADGAEHRTTTMLEAFPGGTWRLLAGTRLPHKGTSAGLRAREALLVRHGVRFTRAPATHGELDAALCAWLGWMLHHAPGRTTFLGRRCFHDAGRMREGVILQVAGAPAPPPAGLS